MIRVGKNISGHEARQQLLSELLDYSCDWTMLFLMPFCMCAKPDDWHMLSRELGIKLFTLTLIICTIVETETFLCCHRESDITKERIQKILAAGANVILTTGGIDDMCLKYFVDVGAMAVRRVLKRDLKRIAKATGGKTRACCSSYICFGFSYTFLKSLHFLFVFILLYSVRQQLLT